MFFKLDSFALIGIEAIKVTIEVHISRGLPGLHIVGLPGQAVNESRQRVRSAVLNSGFDFPVRKIIINLSPADIKKDGSLYDLPLALSILAASGQIKSSIFRQSSFIGELSLNGDINPVRGLISMAEKAERLGKRFFYVPGKISGQASIFEKIIIVPCKDLKSTVRILEKGIKRGKIFINKKAEIEKTIRKGPDFSEVKGQHKAKRALEIAAAGMHNILISGPPGSGKTMLASRMISIFPEMDLKQRIEVTRIHSLCNERIEGLIDNRPFINPHNTVSRAGFIGGGIDPRPGAISLAHRGILFLDELSQFPSGLIEDLRQPLENREVIITRNRHTYCFPCSFMLIAATNPCKCGFRGDIRKECRCSERELMRFWNNLSGPILDRIDIKVSVNRLPEEEYFSEPEIERSYFIKERVEKVHFIQKKRYESSEAVKYNSEAGQDQINIWLRKKDFPRDMTTRISKRFGLSARGMSGVIKVARTIADLDGCINIMENHIMESVSYRKAEYRE